jgi:hypothetical protein
VRRGERLWGESELRKQVRQGFAHGFIIVDDGYKGLGNSYGHGTRMQVLATEHPYAKA